MSRNIDLKVVLLGKEYGGKTSLVERYLHDRFHGDVPYQNTIGAAFGAKKVDCNGQTVTMGIWDTAGSERYEAMSKIYYRGARAAIICYDLTDKASFDRAEFWVNELRDHEEFCKIYLCGTKKDVILENKDLRAVDYHMTTDYGDIINARVIETSSKNGENVAELFQLIAEDYCKTSSMKVQKPKDTVDLKNDNKITGISKIRNRCCLVSP